MKQPLKKILFLFVFIVVSISLSAQSKKGEKPTTQNKTSKENTGKPTVAPKVVSVYLGHSAFTGGNISKQAFDSLIMQGLHGKDSLGNMYKVEDFKFTYAERNYYEDSTGRAMVYTDYSEEHVKGDTLTNAALRNLYEKTKNGDTAYIDQIKLTNTHGTPTAGKPMKFVITK